MSFIKLFKTLRLDDSTEFWALVLKDLTLSLILQPAGERQCLVEIFHGLTMEQCLVLFRLFVFCFLT